MNQQSSDQQKPDPQPLQARTYKRLRETWLSRRPDPSSLFIALTTTSALLGGSLLYWNNIWNASAWMPASHEAVFTRGEVWRLWTALFAHGDFGHLASNSLLFFILGFFLFGYFGLKLFPIAALLSGALANLLALTTYKNETQLIGASGIVYWMGGAWLTLYFFLSRQKNLTQRWLRTFGVALLLFAPSGALENTRDLEAAMRTSHITHLAGFVLGVCSGLLHYWFNRQTYLSAEVYETIVDDDDLEKGDDLPPPEGFQ